jgi:simple sugar transport system permease protein
METLLASLLASTVKMAIPLLLAAIGEVLVERAGVIDIGLEGKLLAGAFTGMVVTFTTGSPLAGVAAAAVAGVALAAVSAYLVLFRTANQVVVGTAVNLLAAGATGVAYRAVFGVTGAALTIPGIAPWRVPGLSSLPVVGEALFAQNWLAYLAFASVPATAWFLYRTLPGLRLRAVGEDPRAAEAQGIRVRRVRAAALLVSGALAGLAGAFLAVAYAQTFVEGMSAGRGFIALAIVVFGRWTPFGALGGALVFGFATALQFHFQTLGLAVPYQLFLVLPYLLTLVILAGFAGQRRAPAALGQPYERG